MHARTHARAQARKRTHANARTQTHARKRTQVMTVIPFSSDDEAVSLANDCAFGLGSSVFSGSSRRARAIGARLEAGALACDSGGADSARAGGVCWCALVVRLLLVASKSGPLAWALTACSAPTLPPLPPP
jgi:hypothetical protein